MRSVSGLLHKKDGGEVRSISGLLHKKDGGEVRSVSANRKDDGKISSVLVSVCGVSHNFITVCSAFHFIFNLLIACWTVR